MVVDTTLSMTEYARLLGISRATVWRGLKTGTLQGEKVDGMWRIPTPPGLVKPQESPYFNTLEAANYLKLSQRGVLDLVESGKLKAIRAGRGFLYRKSDIERYWEVKFEELDY